ncbi:MAG: PepSY-like domain-containing protein [Paludibacteraceae bacterium]
MRKITLIATFVAVSVAAFAQTLPEQAVRFIEEAFPERSVLMVNSKIGFDVVLDDFTKLEFTAHGRWIEMDAEKEGNIPDTAVPEAMLTRIRKAFPNNRIQKIEWSRRTGGYEVELSGDVELEFDSAFQLTDISK